MKTMPGVSAMILVSLAVWLGSHGYSTVELWIARMDARSSSAICDGPSWPISIAVCLAGSDLVLFLVGRHHRLDRGGGFLRRGRPLRFLGLDLQVADPAELFERPLGHVRGQGPAVPAVLVLDLGETLALDRLGDDHVGLGGVGQRLAESAVDG